MNDSDNVFKLVTVVCQCEDENCKLHTRQRNKDDAI